MRLGSIVVNGREQLAVLSGGNVLVLDEAWANQNQVPFTMEALVNLGLEGLEAFTRHQDELGYGSTVAGEWVELNSVRFAPAVARGKKIICVGLNYMKHVDESKLGLPQTPLLFSKFDNALSAHHDTVARPATTSRLDYEAEVAVVIGRKAQNVQESEAFDYVLGYTLANDLSARDLQFATSQWVLGKSLDGFCPVGPALVTRDEVPDISHIQLRCYVNDELRQDGNTEQMIFPFSTLISYISRHFTLEPGDVILSGTPDGVILGLPEDKQVWLQPGDVVRVEAEHLGTLITTIG